MFTLIIILFGCEIILFYDVLFIIHIIIDNASIVRMNLISFIDLLSLNTTTIIWPFWCLALFMNCLIIKWLFFNLIYDDIVYICVLILCYISILIIKLFRLSICLSHLFFIDLLVIRILWLRWRLCLIIKTIRFQESCVDILVKIRHDTNSNDSLLKVFKIK